MEAKEGSVTELLELLRDVSKQFDIRNETHVELLDQLQEIKKVILEYILTTILYIQHIIERLCTVTSYFIYIYYL